MAAVEEKYNGPSAREMIQTHTLARETIARHGRGSQAIFDDDNIRQLRRFVADPAAERAAVLRQYGADGKTQGEVIEIVRSGSHSLVTYAAAVHGTERAALTDEEIAELRDWFASGGGQTEEERVEEEKKQN